MSSLDLILVVYLISGVALHASALLFSTWVVEHSFKDAQGGKISIAEAVQIWFGGHFTNLTVFISCPQIAAGVAGLAYLFSRSGPANDLPAAELLMILCVLGWAVRKANTRYLDLPKKYGVSIPAFHVIDEGELATGTDSEPPQPGNPEGEV